jgi:hypothetical protein
LLIETRSDDALRIKRKQFFMFRNVTVTYPLLLDLIKMPELAEKLRAFGNNKTDMRAAANFLSENKEAITKNANANANAYAYAYACANDYANASAYANAYNYDYAYDYDYAYANANDYAYANDYTYTYAYANAYNYDYAYAYAYRTKVADACVETLRLACGIEE